MTGTEPSIDAVRLLAMNDGWLAKLAEWPDIEPEDAYIAGFEARDGEVERLRTALERVHGMAERPVCLCGRPTGTAAIKAAADAALGSERKAE